MISTVNDYQIQFLIFLQLQKNLRKKFATKNRKHFIKCVEMLTRNLKMLKDCNVFPSMFHLKLQ